MVQFGRIRFDTITGMLLAASGLFATL